MAILEEEDPTPRAPRLAPLTETPEVDQPLLLSVRGFKRISKQTNHRRLRRRLEMRRQRINPNPKSSD